MNQTLIVKFKIKGNLRFLSHQETLSMLKRALVRAGTELCYGQGFNPRPKLSLPLPRSVGVESEDELFYASVSVTQGRERTEILKERISSQLPFGCEIISVEIADGPITFQPESALYVFCLSNADDETVRSNIEALRGALSAKVPLVVQRYFGANRPHRQVDVSGYIDSVELKEDVLSVKCKITGAGSVRIDEIMELIQIDRTKLSGPVKRTTVQWRN